MAGYSLTSVFFLTQLLSLLYANEFCSSREFNGFNGTRRTDNSCPYILTAQEWRPGQRSEMELSHLEEQPFKTFLVSVQVGSSLVGEMTPGDSNTMTACGNTSAIHSDKTTNKTSVLFYWTAPRDLVADEVIVRTSVGTDDMFWKDCEAFYLEMGEIDEEEIETTPAATTTTTATSSSNNSAQVTNPPRKHTVLSATACMEANNHYSVMPNTNCKKFKQHFSGIDYTFDCPLLTRFDVRECVCSHMKLEDCHA